jgi:hypothetical protein
MRIVQPTITFDNGAAIALIDGEWVPYFAGGVSFGYSSSKGGSQQSSGLRNTPQFGQYVQNYADTGNRAASLAHEYGQSPVNMFQGQTGEQITNTNPLTGLPMAFNNNLTSFGNQMFANASAGGSMRGQNSPENTQGVVGSAMTNMGATLLPYIADWQKYVTGLPEEMKRSRFGMYQGTLQAMAPGLGAQGAQKASSFGFDVSGGLMPSGQPTCWIAGVLYGEGSQEQYLIRTWLTSKTHGIWYHVRKVYSKYGERTAQYIQSRSWAQSLFKPLFNYMLKQAR